LVELDKTKNMNKYKIYRIALFLSLAVLLIGFVFKLRHWAGANVFVIAAYFISVVYVVIGVMDTYLDDSKSILEKGVWLAGFLFITPLTGVIYYLTEIKKKPTSR